MTNPIKKQIDLLSKVYNRQSSGLKAKVITAVLERWPPDLPSEPESQDHPDYRKFWSMFRKVVSTTSLGELKPRTQDKLIEKADAISVYSGLNIFVRELKFQNPRTANQQISSKAIRKLVGQIKNPGMVRGLVIETLQELRELSQDYNTKFLT